MQSIGQSVFNGSRHVPPVRRPVDPFFSLRNIRPNSDSCNTSRNNINISVGIVQHFYLFFKPILRQAAFIQNQAVNLRQQPGVGFGGDLAEIGNLADFPQQPDARSMIGQPDNPRIACQRFQRLLVFGFARADQTGQSRTDIQAVNQRVQRRCF